MEGGQRIDDNGRQVRPRRNRARMGLTLAAGNVDQRGIGNGN